jgi:hypothetical protein
MDRLDRRIDLYHTSSWTVGHRRDWRMALVAIARNAIVMLDAVIQMLSKQQRKHARRLSASQRISLQAPA